MSYDPADDMRDEWAQVQFVAMAEDVVDGEHLIDYLIRQEAAMNLVPASVVIDAFADEYIDLDAFFDGVAS